MSTTKKVLIGVGSFVVIIGLLIGLAFYVTSGMTRMIDAQLAALQHGDLEKAYSYTSKDFKAATSYNDFKDFVSNYSGLKNNAGSTFYNRELSNKIGKVSGVLKSKDDAVTPVEFRLVKENGEWRILSIEMPKMGINTAPPADSESQSNMQSKSSPENYDLTNVYENKNLQYAIKYPASWEYELPKKGTVIFSGKKGHDSYYTTVNIQTVLLKDKNQGLKYAVDDLKHQFTDEPGANARFLQEGPFVLNIEDGKQLEGRYFIVTYTHKGETFKQWQIVVIRKDAPVFYAWAYTAPTDLYDSYLSIAKEMLDTWSVY